MSISVPTLAAIRYGFGLRPGEPPPQDAQALLAQLPPAARAELRFPREGITGRRETAEKIIALRRAEAKATQNGKPNARLRQTTQQQANRLYRGDAVARIAQAVTSPYGFHERLASFWADHFAVNADKNLQMFMLAALHEAEAIRPHLAGPFRDLLKAAVLHPAMFFYLDQNRSIGPGSVAGLRNGRGLNENLGRELIELHTLGTGSGYGQADVRAAALILTGVGIDAPRLDIGYRPQRAEPGAFTLLGRSYGGEGRGEADHRAMIDDLADPPATARHICAKLAGHFLADVPPPEVVAPMVASWTASDGNLTEVYRAMLEHPRAWQVGGAKIKRPFDFVVSGLRALDMPEKQFEAMMAAAMPQPDDEDEAPRRPKKNAPRHRNPGFARAMTIWALQRMGQPVWRPTSPAGFADDAASWLTPSQLAERIAWAHMVAQWLAADREPADLLADALGDAAREDTIRVLGQAPNRVHGLAMVLASPEFNRR